MFLFFNYSWYIMLNKFQGYNLMIRHLYNLQSEHPNKSSTHLTSYMQLQFLSQSSPLILNQRELSHKEPQLTVLICTSTSWSMCLSELWSCPGWWGSVGWAPMWEPKHCLFDFHSGHTPGLQARSPVGATWEVTTHWCFSPSLSPSLPLSKNK